MVSLKDRFALRYDYVKYRTLGDFEIMAIHSDSNPPPMKFDSIRQVDVPKGRDGKHKQIVTQLLSDLEQLTPEKALKVPLEALPDSKENIRAALNRATRQRGMDVATSSDEEFLYVWKVKADS
jgi:hypothetical protein